MLERINSILNIVVIVVAAVVLFRPGGPVVRMVQDHLDERETREKVRREWSRLAATEARHGTGEAPVQLVEFFDYECPFCRKAHPVVVRFASRHPEVGIAYRHFPIDQIHPRAEGAAKAAICAEQQGEFQALHAYLMENASWQRGPDWEETARAAGLEKLERFSECMKGEKAEARLEKDRRLAEEIGVRSTPTFVHRDGVHRGVPSVTELEDLLGVSSP